MRNTLLVILVALSGFVSFAQNPFSYYGLGESSSGDHSVFSGIGNTEITLMDSSILNFYNPASYNSLAKGQPLFTLGVSTRLSTYKQGSSSEFSPRSGIQSFAFGFSFAKYFGLGFGLRPYSSKGYDFYDGTEVDSDSITYRYLGNGNISNAYSAFSAELLPFLDSTSLSVGAELGWLFGNVTNARYSYLNSSTINTGGVNLKTTDIRNIHYNFGLLFTHYFNVNHKLGIYGTFDPSQKLNANFSDGIFFSTKVENPNLYDTTYYAEFDGKVVTPSTINFGLSYTYYITDTKEVQHRLHPAISVHAAYGITNWGWYSNPFDPTVDYLSTNKISAGVEFIPQVNTEFSSTKRNIFEEARYRVGFYNYTLPYAQNGVQVSDFGTTFGIGIPITVGNSLSSVSIGASIGKRGTSDVNQINEQYYGINFGISVAPGSIDRWFRKRKIN